MCLDALQIRLPMPRRLEQKSMDCVVDDEDSWRHGLSITGIARLRLQSRSLKNQGQDNMASVDSATWHAVTCCSMVRIPVIHVA